MIEKGTWVQIQSYKHNGTLHRFWDQALVLDIDDEMIVVASKKTRVTEADGRIWYTREPAITFFSRKYWYNVIAMLKSDGVSFYCNIASPTLIDGYAIKYIDYDLDLKLYPNNVIKVLDEREYEHHRQTYQYSNKLDYILKKEVQHIQKMMKKGLFPFQIDKVHSYYQDFLDSLDEQHRIVINKEVDEHD